MNVMNIDDNTIYALVEEQLADGNRVKISIGGKSMLPTLSKSDVIFLEPLQGEPEIGDVLFFRLGGNHIVHRLVRREGDTYVMQGDNNQGVERVCREGLLAKLVRVERANGTIIDTDSEAWQRISRRAECRKQLKHFVMRWLGRKGRRQLRPWYFGAIVFLMWAPLNGVGIPLDNYILGLRADHLLHASVYIPCTLFLVDLFPQRRWLAWLLACCIGLTTEFGQYLLPFRSFDINDMVSNFLGVSLGWLIVRRKVGRASKKI